jgi:long-chain acyl-CoA synthetase
MRGYWNRPDETAAVLTPDGWLRTGDMGYMDERGFLWMIDRKKDLTLTEVSPIAHCRAHLTGYKLPQRVEFTAGPLSKTHLGKILRCDLRQAASQVGRA